MKSIIQYILKLLAKAVIWKYRPTVIGITGNVGKSSSKEAIFAVVNSRFKARRNLKNYNNEIGLPLAILGEESAGKNIFKWLAIFSRASRLIVFRADYPEILILEMGADKPGDIGYLISIVRPKIGVVTAIGEIPAHVEFFAGPEELAEEKSKLVAALPTDGFAILNFDDDTVLAMKSKIKAHPLTFGLGEGASVRATDIHLSFRREAGHASLSLGEAGEPSGGLSFKVSYKGSIVPVRLVNVFGKHQIYAALAAVGVGSALNMNLVEISQALADYKSPPGRLNLLKGIKNTVILDDTYNASPMATRAALETLSEISLENPARKIVVLGDMLEIGKYTIEAHKTIGEIARKIADIIFVVGPRAKFIAEEAEELGFPKDKIFRFDDPAAAGKELQKIIQEGDLILVKGSQSMRMEKIVEEIMAEPLRAKELLARQGEEWNNE